MPLSEQNVAWIIIEMLAMQRSQADIARQLRISQSAICNNICDFTEAWTGRNLRRTNNYGQERLPLAQQALRQYLASGKHSPTVVKPALQPINISRARYPAMREYAYHLFTQGASYQEIADRLGIPVDNTDYRYPNAKHLVESEAWKVREKNNESVAKAQQRLAERLRKDNARIPNALAAVMDAWDWFPQKKWNT